MPEDAERPLPVKMSSFEAEDAAAKSRSRPLSARLQSISKQAMHQFLGFHGKIIVILEYLHQWKP
jgi:hypothetical protein